MYRRLPESEKKALIKRVLVGESVSSVCKQEKISRTVFYKWLKENKNESKTKRKTKRHWKRLDNKTEAKIIKLALSNPSFSPQRLANNLNLSSHGVWNVLKRNGFNKQEEREKHSLIYGTCLVKAQPASNKVTMIRRFEAGEKVSQICKDFGVSRTVFYRWLKRYNEANRDSLALENLRPNGEKHWRFVPGASDLILQVVVEHPEFSPIKIKEALIGIKGKQVVGAHGVYNILKRLNLNTYQRRLAYANSQPQISTQEEKALGWRLPGFIKFQFISDISPPVIYSGLASVFVFFLLFFIVKTFSQGLGITYTIGSVFSLLSLIFGMFFFLYSLKYYFTIAVVLSFSRQGQDEEEKEKGSFFSRLFGISITRGNQKNDRRVTPYKEYRGGGGLQPDLSNISLEREPFVSIHLATYNEKRVVDRLLTAATSMDYRNFEIIVADDSKDETVDLLDKWAKHPNVKVLHRKNREGYKGGALKEALKVTDPRAEFIMIFDADFIPYPDTIVNFLKYFQNLCGDLKKKTLENSKIGAVQGYQWHVLNKSENWITRGVRSEYAGSYVIERSGEEIYSGLKQISGSVYMIQTHVLKELGWGTSITEDFELTLRLYEKGYKVVYTPYIQAPAEAVSTIKRLIRQRMRWAEGHSFNVKAMFTRLMFSQNLTKSEKFEFLYLTPYYLQAFLFILGTFFWLIAEVIFKVRLPFWTEIWGWSLVFTNLFALPLMNMVGLFLEESEEKDYLGLFSFIALSYIVAPFQAYAAFKGFTEEKEGPWFRTPKTGRITDIFTPGRFYRKIFGIFGRPSAAPVMQSIDSRYLALATANNRFDNFKIRPKKVHWIGKVSVASILVFALLLNIASFGHNSETKVGEEIAKKSDTSKLSKDFKISGKNTFAPSETPSFHLTSPEPAQKAKSPLTRLFLTRVDASEPEIKTSLFDHRGVLVKDINPKLVRENSDYKLTLEKNSSLAPGKYTLVAKWDDGAGHTYESTQDFNWGVLAVNTNKSVYTAGETAKFSFGVLDDRGSTICDAENLTLDVQMPKGKETLSLSNLKIQKSGKCFGNNPSETPDYSGSLSVKEIGIYKLKLTAKTKNGEKSIEDKFEVRKNVPFDIERTFFPTRNVLNPPYEVFLTIKANKDFKGEIEDSVPENFEISKFNYKNGVSEIKDNSSIQQFSNLSTKDNRKIISWNADLKKGENIKIGYQIKFPQVSPQFYLLGPLKLKSEARPASDFVFGEARTWQIAADAATATYIDAGSDSYYTTTVYNQNSANTSSDSTAASVHTGPRSIKWYSNGSNVAWTGFPYGVWADTGSRFSGWFYFDTLPSTGDSSILDFVGPTGSDQFYLRLTTGGKLKLWNRWTDTQIGTTGTATISTGTWTRISVAYVITSQAVNDYRVWVNGGTADISVHNQDLTVDYPNGISTLFLGMLSAANYGDTNYFHGDDFYLDQDTSLTDPGDIRVTAKLPSGDTNRGFDTIIGAGGACVDNSTEYGCVNERTLSEAKGVRDNTRATGTKPIENFAIQDSATGDVDISANTYVAYQSWFWAERGGTSGTLAVGLYNNSSTPVAKTITFTPDLYSDTVTSTSYPTDTNAVGMQGADSTTDSILYEAGMQVAFSGAPVPEIALILGPLAVFVPKIIKSIQNGTLVEDFKNLLAKIFSNVYKIFWSLPYLRRRQIIRDKRRRKRQRLRC